MFALPSHTVRSLSRHWTGRLARFRLHLNDEHREALIADALKYAGLRLEQDLSDSEYWSQAPLARRVAVMLYLVDRGAVSLKARNGRTLFEANEGAEDWATSEASLEPYRAATLELIAALRSEQARRTPAAE